jgi:integral membrane sensor domain MASE1
MHERAASITGQRQIPWQRKHWYAVSLMSCFISVALGETFVQLFTAGTNQVGGNFIWVANGVLLAYLLLSPRWHWPAYLGVAFVALSLAGVFIDKRFLMTNLPLTALNLLEVWISAYLLRRRSNRLPDFTDRAYLIRFACYALLAGPAVAGSIYALIATLWLHASPAHAFLGWAPINSLGTAVATPAFVAIFRTRFRNIEFRKRSLIYPALLAAVTLASFSSLAAPLLTLIYPLLILILIDLGLGFASVATLFIATVGGWYTFHGTGPLALAISTGSAGASLRVQMMVASAMFMLYCASIILEQQKTIQRRLEKIVSLHRLVTDNSRDVIIVADFNGNRSYVSSASELLGGWTPKEAKALTSIELVHPEDQYKAKAAIREMRSGREDTLVECRVRKANGE